MRISIQSRISLPSDSGGWENNFELAAATVSIPGLPARASECTHGYTLAGPGRHLGRRPPSLARTCSTRHSVGWSVCQQRRTDEVLFRTNQHHVKIGRNEPSAVSCRVVSSRVVSCRVVQCRVVSCRVVPCRVVPCRIVPPRVASCGRSVGRSVGQSVGRSVCLSAATYRRSSV